MVPLPEHLADLGPEVLRSERLRGVDGCSLASSAPGCLPTGRRIAAEDLEDASLHQLIRRAAGRQRGRRENQIRAVLAAAPLAEPRRTAAGPPLLLGGRSLDRDGPTIEDFSTWHRWDLIAFDVEAVPPSARQRIDDERIDRLTRTARELLAELEQLA